VAIFGGLIWESIVIKSLVHDQLDTEIKIIVSLLFVATFFRTLNITAVLLYIVFVLPLSCCP